MYNFNENFRRLPLENVHNLRDLGGYPGEDYTTTRWHVFLRSDNIYGMSEWDRKFLQGYGLTTIIDLRSPDEIKDKPNPYASDNRVEYFNIPLINMNMSKLIDDTVSSKNVNMFKLSDLYIGIAEQSKAAMKRIFHEFARPEAACTLFHCTAGKDRTGVIAAMLLHLAGVPLEDILSNYEITNTHLRKVYGEIKYVAPELPISLIESNPANIETFIKHIDAEYGSAARYLKSIGVTEDEIFALKNKFLKPA